MSQLTLLRASFSLHHAATLLQFQPKYLAYILYKMPDATKYHSFKIAKRGGGFRQIDAPCPELIVPNENPVRLTSGRRCPRNRESHERFVCLCHIFESVKKNQNAGVSE